MSTPTVTRVACPGCGAEATLLPDGAIFCSAENAIARRFPPDVRLPGTAAEPARRPRPAKTERVIAEYGYVNVAILVFVAAAVFVALLLTV